MVGDLDLRTELGDRTKALLVVMGEANRPEPEPEKEVSQGQSEKTCTTFLITRDHEPVAVELIQGWHSDALEWLLKNEEPLWTRCLWPGRSRGSSLRRACSWGRLTRSSSSRRPNGTVVPRASRWCRLGSPVGRRGTTNCGRLRSHAEVQR